VLARGFARRGCDVVGVDVSAAQLEEARRLAAAERLGVEFRLASAEETGLADASFDLVTAAQCWLYFDEARTVAEVKRVLAPGGLLLTCHLNWLPRLDPVARASEALVLRHNARWSAADGSGSVPPLPAWADGRFDLTAMFVYDEPIPFTRETWRGRFRACRAIGATLAPDEVARFDAEHARLLEVVVGERFAVLHRVDAHLFRPR
ncbi:MAG: class I SAM-dependent methyltransferase, partial [Planctomycetota bacterium]